MLSVIGQNRAKAFLGIGHKGFHFEQAIQIVGEANADWCTSRTEWNIFDRQFAKKDIIFYFAMFTLIDADIRLALVRADCRDNFFF